MSAGPYTLEEINLLTRYLRHAMGDTVMLTNTTTALAVNAMYVDGIEVVFPEPRYYVESVATGGCRVIDRESRVVQSEFHGPDAETRARTDASALNEARVSR